MDRGTWQATVYGVTRVRHNLATKLLTTNIRTPQYIRQMLVTIEGGIDSNTSHVHKEIIQTENY